MIKAWGVFQDGKFWRAESVRAEARAVAYPGQQVKRIEIRIAQDEPKGSLHDSRNPNPVAAILPNRKAR